MILKLDASVTPDLIFCMFLFQNNNKFRCLDLIEEYAERFEKACITRDVLCTLTEEELETDLGITKKFHRRAILVIAGNLKNGRPASLVT